MVRDGVANIVDRLRECGFDPHKVGRDLWEARCPAHRSADHALAITRNGFDLVVLECRSTHNCQYYHIIGALGFTNDHVYAETPDWMISRLSHVEIQPAMFKSSQAQENSEEASDLHRSNVHAVDVETESSPDTAKPLLAPRLEAVPEAKIPPDGGTPTDGCATEGDRSQGHEEPDAAQTFVSPASPSESAAPPGETPPGEPLAGDSVELPVFNPPSSDESSDKLERVSAVQVLARLASSARLFRSADGRFCAQVAVGNRLEIYGLKSEAFRDWLIAGYLIGQPEPPSSWAIRRVVGMLEARARFSTGIPEVFIRVGSDGDSPDSPYFLDLGDPSGRAIAIGDQGWQVVDRPGVYFRRPEGLLSLPLPEGVGSIDLLRQYVNLTEADFRLMIAWLTAALRPVGPYPILVLNGEQSSGKSTLAKILRRLIDPQACPVLALPKSAQDLMATAVNGWLLVYENISAIAGSLSDCMCQLAFGGGFASRTLFTNDERSVIYAQRPLILVGVEDFVVRGDLRDRCVFLHLPSIPRERRRTERKFWPAFRADYPRILGGVLDAIVGGLRELPSVDLKELPRMADYAEWGEATSRGLGWGAGTFVSTYDDNRKEATDVVLEESPLAAILLTYAERGINWFGTPLELYRGISERVGKRVAAGARWPKTVHTFGTELRRIAPQLRLHGLSINFERTRDARIITLRSEGNTTSR